MTTPPSTSPVDVDALMDEVRARVRERRASGRFSPAVEAALGHPLPGGTQLFADDLAEPLKALPDLLDREEAYDPRSRKRFAGPFITLGRKTLMWLLRMWIVGIVDRQERVNRLVLAALRQQENSPSPGFDARLAAVEESLARRSRDEVAANLEWKYFSATFSGTEEVIRAQAEPFVARFANATRVLDLGSGRGFVLELLRQKGIGAYGVDLDPGMVAACRARGLEAYEDDAERHLRTVADRSLDGIYAAHVAEHVAPGKLIEILRQARRVLKPGASLVMATPNAATLTVTAHTFWLDPSHQRPIPPELFTFYLEVEGFTDVELHTYAPSGSGLSEDVPEGPLRDNVRLLNKVLFGDRDYTVVGRAP